MLPSANTRAQNIAVGAYLVVVWVVVTTLFRHGEHWGYVHAGLAAIIPAVAIGGAAVAPGGHQRPDGHRPLVGSS